MLHRLRKPERLPEQLGRSWGSKKSQSDIIRGTKDVNLAYPAELWELAFTTKERTDENPKCRDRDGALRG